jgi:hypothetical protein
MLDYIKIKNLVALAIERDSRNLAKRIERDSKKYLLEV